MRAVPKILETPRLILRPFESNDAEAAFGWFGDLLVMRFTSTGPDKSLEETQARLTRYQEHQEAHGFSKWMILDRVSETPIGDAGLLDLKDYGWIDLGYRFAQSHWGKGLATEAASAWVRVGFGEFHFDQINAFVHPENIASIRVLQKLNFRTVRRDTIMGMDAILFALRAKDARAEAVRRPA
jgi:RimJ/RimL family protein N-acetyltransferase